MGASVLEIVLDERLKTRTTATLRMMGITEIPAVDILTNATRNQHSEESQNDKLKKNLSAAIYRLRKNAQKASNQWAKRWYEDALARATAKLETLTLQTTQPITEGRNIPTSAGSTPDNEADWIKVVNKKNPTSNRSTGVKAGSNPDNAKSANPLTTPTKRPNKESPADSRPNENEERVTQPTPREGGRGNKPQEEGCDMHD